jgi:hypothetical protein
MTFSTVVFGSISVTGSGTYTYTDGSSITTGGLILYIVPTRNVGGSGIDIGFTYINQFGVTKTTTVSTAVASGKTSGTHIQVVLEPGDTGIRDLIGINYFAGGTAGDALNLESWNEGLGAPALDLTLTDPFDRTVPGSFFPEPYLFEFPGNTYDLLSTIPDLYYSNPQIKMELSSSNKVAFLPETMIDRDISVREEGIIKSDGTLEWITGPTIRTIVGREFILLRSWLESVVGQVVSGYIQNISGDVIKNAFSLILMSTIPTEITPGGTSTVSDVNPDTGLYQTFLKEIIYDKRYIIIKVGVKNVALEGAGIPAFVDGNQQLIVPYNLQFACPILDCDFNITRKV